MLILADTFGVGPPTTCLFNRIQSTAAAAVEWLPTQVHPPCRSVYEYMATDPVETDLTNPQQAIIAVVHIWFAAYFGLRRPPFGSSSAIQTKP